jgi:sterol desaturase/sphingolipid hydroxylase (fatty acid hydroxylase superfamily)
MAVIDSVILSLTERACRRFQRLTGRTNVWLAAQLTNLSIIVYFVWAALYSVSIDPVLRTVAALFGVGVLYALTQTIFKVPIELHETAAYRRVAKGLRNPRQIRDALLRISFLTLSLLLGYPVVFLYINLHLPLVLLSYLLIVLTTVVLYLVACDPLPPCVGKIPAWLRRTESAHPPWAEPVPSGDTNAP